MNSGRFVDSFWQSTDFGISWIFRDFEDSVGPEDSGNSGDFGDSDNSTDFGDSGNFRGIFRIVRITFALNVLNI